MSKENHPNFHAVKFTTEIMRAFQECLRGRAVGMQMAGKIQETILTFVKEIEYQVDQQTEE
jgi:hypothetical protein